MAGLCIHLIKRLEEAASFFQNMFFREEKDLSLQSLAKKVERESERKEKKNKCILARTRCIEHGRKTKL